MEKIKKLKRACTNWWSPRLIIHENEKDGIIFIQDTSFLEILNYDEMKKIVSGLQKFMESITEEEIKEHNRFKRREVISEYEEQTGKKFN
jgi:hypothetical protein